MSSKSTSEMLRSGHSFAVEAEKAQTSGLTADENYKKLRAFHSENALKLNLLQMFKEDNQRFEKFRYEFISSQMFTAFNTSFVAIV